MILPNFTIIRTIINTNDSGLYPKTSGGRVINKHIAVWTTTTRVRTRKVYSETESSEGDNKI